MAGKTVIEELDHVSVRFSGDSGDGMQLSGTIFSTLSAIFGNEIATFPDYPAEIRAPQGSLQGVSGYQVRIGKGSVYSSGDRTDVLVAMNPSALKVNAKYLSKKSIVVFDSDSFGQRDLDKAEIKTDDIFKELGIDFVEAIPLAISSMTKASLQDFEMDAKSVVRCKNMFALGFVCWLFNRPLEIANELLERKFAKKPILVQANVKVLTDGYNYGANTHATASTYRIETISHEKGFYTDINGNTATAYGLIAAAEKAGRKLFLGSYPITPATEVLQEIVKRKDLGARAIQMEDEIAGICSAIGGSFAGCLSATSTSGPGLALKSEAMGLAVIAELPLVIIDVQRGGPSTGLPTKSEQADLAMALYGRNGESPLVVLAATSPTDCFDSAYWAGKIALEHMTPVILLTDGYIANGSSAWKIPDLDDYPDISPNYVANYPDPESWKSFVRNDKTLARYWAIPGDEGFMHRIGGLEKDYLTGAISTGADNHELMVRTRKAKIDKVAEFIPELEVIGDEDADTLVIGWGGTYGHFQEAVERVRESGRKLALAQFRFISPLPKNTEAVLKKYKKIVVAEQNTGQFADYLSSKIKGLDLIKFNRIKGQPFKVWRLVEEFSKLIDQN